MLVRPRPYSGRGELRGFGVGVGVGVGVVGIGSELAVVARGSGLMMLIGGIDCDDGKSRLGTTDAIGGTTPCGRGCCGCSCGGGGDTDATSLT
jgi:hypothetical protein